MIKSLLKPRALLVLWGSVGAVGLSYLLITASVKPKALERSSACLVSASDRAPAFQTGEMADFAYAFTTRLAPDTQIASEEGTISLQDFRGRAVLVNFWATWCAPCLRELPSLDALQGEMGGDGFAVVAVAADPKGPEAAAAYLERLNIEHLTLYTDARLALASAVGGASVLPLSVLYNASGKEIGRLTGEADWASGEARALIRSVIACP